MVIFAIVVALGLIAVVEVGVTLTAEKAEAKGCTPGGIGFNASEGECAGEFNGCRPGLTGFNASEGRCFDPDS